MDIETDDSSTDEDRPFIKSKTGEFTYLDADEELLEPFEKLGWFSGRPNYYFAENIFIWVRNFISERFRTTRPVLRTLIIKMVQLYGLNSVVNWLFVMMALAKGIIGMIAMKNAFIFQVAFAGLVRVSNSRLLSSSIRLSSDIRISSDCEFRIQK